LSRTHDEIGGQVAQLTDPDKATRLVFHHDGGRTESPSFGECNYTKGRCLRSLRLYCETGKGRPFPNEHRTNP
jgi:hypothetical protein